MKRNVAALMMALLCLCAALAAADARPMTKYAPGQMINIGWGDKVRFMAGCTFDDGNGFVLVNTDFNGGYLLKVYGMDWQVSISGGLPVPDGCSAEIYARDESGCIVCLSTAGMSRTYTFVHEPTQVNPDCWLLSSYEQKDGESYFLAEFDLDRVQAVQRAGSQEQRYTTYYAFYNEANNLDHAKVPGSIDDMKRLEAAYPVAAVSPDDPASRVNLRKGPSTKAERVGSLYSGARLRIREIEDGWAKIHVGDTDAYISTQFLTFGAEIENVPDMRPTAQVRDGEWIEVSRVPYRGGGGSVSQTRGGQQVRIMGEYNDQWRIVSANPGSYYIHTDNLR